MSSSNDTIANTGLQNIGNSNTDRSANMSENPDASSSSKPPGTPPRFYPATQLNETDPPRDQTTGDGDNDLGNAKGSEPGVVEEKSKKLTGTAAPGSHSALFGLTPDGHRETNIDYSSTKPTPAQGDDGAGRDRDATSSRATGSSPPVTDPQAADKVNVGGDAITAGLKDDKPGTGSAAAAPSQSTGKAGKDA